MDNDNKKLITLDGIMDEHPKTLESIATEKTHFDTIIKEIEKTGLSGYYPSSIKKLYDRVLKNTVFRIAKKEKPTKDDFLFIDYDGFTYYPEGLDEPYGILLSFAKQYLTSNTDEPIIVNSNDIDIEEDEEKKQPFDKNKNILLKEVAENMYISLAKSPEQTPVRSGLYKKSNDTYEHIGWLISDNENPDYIRKEMTNLVDEIIYGKKSA